MVHGGTLANSVQILAQKTSQTEASSGADATVPFVVDYVQAVDLFPHTPHCELVVAFSRLAS